MCIYIYLIYTLRVCIMANDTEYAVPRLGKCMTMQYMCIHVYAKQYVHVATYKYSTIYTHIHIVINII